MMENYPKIEILWNRKEDPFLTFIVGVHGDEKAPIEALDILKERLENQSLKKNIRIIYANVKAMNNNTRFIESDLNDSFFDKWKWTYEEELAKILKKELKKTAYNFDFHTTNFPIKSSYWVISVYTDAIKEILSSIWVKNNVFTDKECLIKYCPNGIWFEAWNEKDPDTIANALKIMENILEHFEIIPRQETPTQEDINIFLIYKVLKKSEFTSINKDVVDFTRVNKWAIIGIQKDGKEFFAEEDFYPIWVDDTTFIRMAKKIHIEE